MALVVWLAAWMSDRSYLATLIDSDKFKSRHRRVGATIGGFVGLTIGLVVAFWNGMIPREAGWDSAPARIELGTLSGLGAGLGVALIYIFATRPGRVAVVEVLRWSWKKALRWVATGLIIGPLLGYTYGLVSGRPSEYILGISNGVFICLILGLLLGLESGQIDTPDKKMIPNQGIRRSARIALSVGGMIWLSTGAVAAAGDVISFVNGEYGAEVIAENMLPLVILWSVTTWGIWASSFGVGASFLYGGYACIQHMLLRMIFFRDRAMPWRYIRFLDYAADRGLLIKVGGGYQFVHQVLQDYYAELPGESGT
jgi:hypothetical protein